LNTDAYQDGSYIAHERAYYFNCLDPESMNPLDFKIKASEDCPIQNLALIISNLDSNLNLKINGQVIPRGKHFRYGIQHDFDVSKIIVWIKIEAHDPTHIIITPIGVI
jgi:hypothetical protein